MASIRNLKKEINYVLGELIDVVTIWEVTTGKEQPKAQAVVEEIISTYNVYVKKINDKQTKRNSVYFRSVRKELENDINVLVEKINALS